MPRSRTHRTPVLARRIRTAAAAVLVFAIVALAVLWAIPGGSAALINAAFGAPARETAVLDDDALGSVPDVGPVANAGDAGLPSGSATSTGLPRIDPFSRDPEVTRLEPGLRTAVRQAALGAQAAGVKDFWLTSGWRSRQTQQELFDQAVTRYGSEQEVLRWVASPATSEHVAGDAVDIGPAETAQWMHHHSAEFGLCRMYANEIWHYELRPEGADHCPAMVQDSAHRVR